jgi:hypothetical protein
MIDVVPAWCLLKRFFALDLNKTASNSTVHIYDAMTERDFTIDTAVIEGEPTRRTPPIGECPE